MHLQGGRGIGLLARVDGVLNAICALPGDPFLLVLPSGLITLKGLQMFMHPHPCN